MQTIFIVEPDKVLLGAYVEALTKKERQIIAFSTANLAVRALEKIVPDVILMELALPGHNGFELLYELHSYADTRKVKIVINSFIREEVLPWGYINRDDLSIVDYLHKPFASLNDIARAINGIE